MQKHFDNHRGLGGCSAPQIVTEMRLLEHSIIGTTCPHCANAKVKLWQWRVLCVFLVLLLVVCLSLCK